MKDNITGKNMLVDSEIQSLIQIPKRVVEARPKNGMAPDIRNEYSQRKTLKLTSQDAEHEFEVFLRHNTKFPEQFSIGLIYNTRDRDLGKIVLLRYNGAHGSKDYSKDGHYGNFHIHKITEALLMQGIIEPSHIEITKAYSSFDGARAQFCKDTGILNAKKYFPGDAKQLDLFK